ncbi:MAG TPA: hypothetical protein VN018_03490, partial [Brevundimonas sp.]|nr:hypothetical protein [Brevundimonas sp.]
MRFAITTILFGLGLAAPLSAMAQEPASWGQALREDAQAFHDVVAENHPGPVDVQNPAFNVSLEDGLALALDRARTADSYSAWRAALTEYAASFDDGHLGLKDIRDNTAATPITWPGFLVGLRSAPGGDRYEVAFNRDAAAPPVGAVLVSCDGRPADVLAQEMIGREAGRWSLRSTRVSHAVWTFVDTGNPYVRRPEQCDFTVDGGTTRHALSWRPLAPADRDAGISAASGQRFTASTALRSWDRGLWIELGDF